MTDIVKRTTSVVIVSLLVALAALSSGNAAPPIVEFDSPEKAALYQQLLNEFRCVKCQNQTIANSPAGIADDMRRKIYDQVAAGKNRDEIAAYLVARYGDFVLYKPPFQASTIALWLGPFLLLVLALWYAWRISSRANPPLADVSESELNNAKALLSSRDNSAES